MGSGQALYPLTYTLGLSMAMRDAIEARLKWDRVNMAQWLRAAILEKIQQDDAELYNHLAACESRHETTRGFREYLDQDEVDYQNWKRVYGPF